MMKLSEVREAVDAFTEAGVPECAYVMVGNVQGALLMGSFHDHRRRLGDAFAFWDDEDEKKLWDEVRE